MKLNLERSFTAPFTSMGESSLLSTYLIAGGITLLAALIIMGFQMIVQAITGVAQVSAGNDDVMVAVVGIISIVASLLAVIINMTCMALPWGYVVETIKLEVYDRTSIMPSWSGNFGRFFWNGVKLQLVMLIYGILVALLCIIPILLVVAVAILVHGQGSSDITAIIGSVGGIICFIIVGIIVLVYCVMMPMIFVTFAAEGRISAALNIFAIWGKIFSNILEYVLALIIVILLSIVIGIVGSIFACVTLCIGGLALPLLYYFIFPIIIFNMFAQLYKD
jgi:hypothetical protein